MRGHIKRDPTEQPFMGMSEIADYFGVTRQAVNNWHARPKKGFPEPYVTLAVGPVWRTVDIVCYKKELDANHKKAEENS